MTTSGMIAVGIPFERKPKPNLSFDIQYPGKLNLNLGAKYDFNNKKGNIAASIEGLGINYNFNTSPVQGFNVQFPTYNKERIKNVFSFLQQKGKDTSKIKQEYLPILEDAFHYGTGDEVLAKFDDLTSRQYKSGGTIDKVINKNLKLVGKKVKVVSGGTITLPKNLSEDQAAGRIPAYTDKNFDYYLNGDGEVVKQMKVTKNLNGGKINYMDLF